jgi:hypothetical protein
MATMAQIEAAALDFSLARAALVSSATAFQNDLNGVKQKHSARAEGARGARQEKARAARGLLQDGRALFLRPKSVMFHGIKVGYKKGTGKIEWEDADQVVKLIKKHFPDQADVLIISSEKPAKDALAQLTAAELKKLGVLVEESGDVPFIKDTSSEVDKLVAAFLKDEATDEEQAPAAQARRAA